MVLDNLMFEVGRGCNMRCAHCLRGEAQNVQMQKDCIDKVLENVESINSLTLSGGEPMMYPDTIEYIINKIIERKISVMSFFIATNGSISSEKVAMALVRLYSWAYEKEFCELKISADKYHTNNLEVVDFWKMFSFTHVDSSLEDRHLLAEGRAFDIVGATRKPSDDGIEMEDDDTVSEGIIYINALGDVLTGCDYSYESQQWKSHGNVYDSDFCDIIRSIA